MDPDEAFETKQLEVMKEELDAQHRRRHERVRTARQALDRAAERRVLRRKREPAPRAALRLFRDRGARARDLLAARARPDPPGRAPPAPGCQRRLRVPPPEPGASATGASIAAWISL